MIPYMSITKPTGSTLTGTGAQWVKVLLGVSASHTVALVLSPSCSTFSIQLPANVTGKVAEDASSAWRTRHTRGRPGWVLGFWLRPGSASAPAAEGIWGVNQWTDDLLISFSPCHSFKQKNFYIECIDHCTQLGVGLSKKWQLTGTGVDDNILTLWQ